MKKLKDSRSYHYQLDQEGQLWISGSQLKDAATLKFFLKNLEKVKDKTYQVHCMGELNLIQVEDVPYVVQDLQFKEDQVELVFAGNYKEFLDPSTLWVGKDHVLYCKVRKSQMEARFNRKSYLELTQKVIEHLGKYYFEWQDKLFEIVFKHP
ncbi:MAG: DUF1285 domain-containing protein [Deltaproteobacteria bacterium]|nr:DUF1285 domain-containing protein [Deltaproteobacteria bacterium]